MPPAIERPWRTAMGKDCANLDVSLCAWLGDRLLFLVKHTDSYPDPALSLLGWRRLLTNHGNALKAYATHEVQFASDARSRHKHLEAAKRALHWVADNLSDLWD